MLATLEVSVIMVGLAFAQYSSSGDGYKYCHEAYEEDAEHIGDAIDALCVLTPLSSFPLQLGCWEYMGEHRDSDQE